MISAVNPRQRLRLFYALASLPFIDCVCDQLNNALHLTLGPISLLQALHGSLMLAFAFICLRAAYRDPSRLWRIPLPAAGALLLLAMASTKELVVVGTLSFASIGPYGQMAYWVMLWIMVAMTCDEAHEAEILLRGLAVGALATAASVFLGFVFGAQNYYQTDAVSSSAGWFDTAKMVTGVLVTGGVVILYLGRKYGGWLAPALACTCFAACILTYARAGSVALGGVLLWLPLWAMLFGRNGRRQWVSRFLVLALVGGALSLAVAGPSKLFARWGDVKQGDQAGSGRAAFWKIAADNYLAATPATQALGRGYGAMAEMLFRDYGMNIKHTHNDLLDMLTVGGLAGACWLGLFITSLFWRVARSHIASVEGAAGMAILLNYLLHSQFTGQLWGTDAMSYYMVSLACLSVLARHAAHQPHATTPSKTSSTPTLGLAMPA